jgi:uncharacterized membrane protein YczE
MSGVDEVKRLTALYDGSERELVAFLSGQLAVLKGQAQALLGIGGLCITVTGFSGHNMVNAGPTSAALMISGIGLITLAIGVAIRVLAGIRWVSQDLQEPVEELVSAVVSRRDRQQRALSLASLGVGVGLLLYVGAVVTAALAGSPWTPP